MKKIIGKTILAAVTSMLVLTVSVGTLFLSAGTVLAGTDDELTVFVTIVDKGTVKLANEKITMMGTAGQDFTIDDALGAAHELFYEGGAEAGYGSAETNYGLSMTKLWGDESGAYGYYVNNASAWELSQTLSQNDVVYAFIYSDQTFWSDAFSFFDKTAYDAESGMPLTVTLKYISGYDPMTFAPIESPLSDAVISCINPGTGAASSVTTDSDGKANLTFTADGIYKITAAKEDTVLALPVSTVYVGSGQKETEPEKTIVITKTEPKKTSAYEFGNEWGIISESRLGTLTEEHALEYYKSVAKKLNEKKSAQLDRSRGTENSRVILGLTAAGFDAEDVNGYNLFAPLANYDFAIKQGVNGVMYALLALNSNDYELPKAEAGKTQATEENLIKYLLDNMTGKGWAWSGTTPDVDLTAMGLYSLAPYYLLNSDVAKVIDEAVAWLSENQNESGGYNESFSGSDNCCSAAEVMMALSTLGISSMNDERFIKNNISLHNALNLFKTDGGYKYLAADTAADDYSTTQANRAMNAYNRMVNKKTAYFDMSDITLKVGPKTEIPKTKDTENFMLWMIVLAGAVVFAAIGTELKRTTK